MALLGLPTALLQDLLAQRPAAAPLLLKARLSPGEVLELRRHALEFAEGPADAL